MEKETIEADNNPIRRGSNTIGIARISTNGGAISIGTHINANQHTKARLSVGEER